jgi:hypothetical protein
MSKASTIANQKETREIPRNEWIPFMAQFTRENRGSHARLEVVGPDTETGDEVRTENRPFDGVSADLRDRERTVWIAFSSKGGDQMTHGVHGAKAVRVLRPHGAAGPVLEIETDDGGRTILELTPAESYALPYPSRPTSS